MNLLPIIPPVQLSNVPQQTTEVGWLVLTIQLNACCLVPAPSRLGLELHKHEGSAHGDAMVSVDCQTYHAPLRYGDACETRHTGQD